MPLQYNIWANVSTPDDFYTNGKAKQLYKDHMSYIVNRENTFTGRLYKDEPAIFAWYAPRCLIGCNRLVDTFLQGLGHDFSVVHVAHVHIFPVLHRSCIVT